MQYFVYTMCDSIYSHSIPLLLYKDEPRTHPYTKSSKIHHL